MSRQRWREEFKNVMCIRNNRLYFKHNVFVIRVHVNNGQNIFLKKIISGQLCNMKEL